MVMNLSAVGIDRGRGRRAGHGPWAPRAVGRCDGVPASAGLTGNATMVEVDQIDRIVTGQQVN